MTFFQNSHKTIFMIMVFLTVMLAYVTNAQMTMAPSPASSVSSECVNVLFNLTDCLTYVEAGSNSSKPDKPCCPELAGLIESNPICLCELLAGAAESYGISVDNERALALPKICHIEAPPVSTCAVLGVPVSMGPSAAEAPGPSGTSPLLPGSSAASPDSGAGSKSNGAARINSANSIILVASSLILTAFAISGKL